MSKNTKVAIYTRVSTEDQAREGYSLSVQRDFLMEFAKKQGYEVFHPNGNKKHIYEDDGYSGYVLDRPALNNLLEDARNKKFNLVIVYKLDRFSRRLKDLLNILDELETLGIEFKSATEPYDTTTSSGKLMLQQLGSFAEFERNQIIERVVPGMIRGVKAGHWQGARYVPFGYSHNKETKKLEIMEREAVVVREIFQKYNSGIPTQVIAGELYERKMKTKSGGLFNSSLVRKILRNKVYTGRLVWGSRFYDRKQKTRKGYFKYVKNDPSKVIITENSHERIISEEHFEKAQRRLDQNRRASFIRQRKFRYPISGTLTCGKCGSAYMGVSNVKNHMTGEKRRYYRCSGRYMRNHKCGNGDVRAEIIEAQVLEEIEILFSNQEIDYKRLANLILEKQKENVSETEKTKLENLNRDLKKCLVKQSKLTDAYLEESVSQDIFKEKNQNLRNEEGEIRIRIERQELELLRKETSQEYVEKARLVVKEFASIEEIDPVTQREFFKLLFKNLTITDHKLRNFLFHEPFQTMYEDALKSYEKVKERRKIDWIKVMGPQLLKRKNSQPCLLSPTDAR